MRQPYCLISRSILILLTGEMKKKYSFSNLLFTTYFHNYTYCDTLLFKEKIMLIIWDIFLPKRLTENKSYKRNYLLKVLTNSNSYEKKLYLCPYRHT